MPSMSFHHRFCGPPATGNGGYVSGRLAALVGGAAEVTLRQRAPLDTELDARIEADGAARLYHAEMLLAEARAAELDLVPPVVPDLDAARAATARYLGFESTGLPGCFVCGTGRPHGDGLRIFAGPLDPAATGPTPVAAPWVPEDDLAGQDGLVAPEFLWAVLDCPGAYAVMGRRDLTMVLGRLVGRTEGRLRVGESCTVVGWPLGGEGRKLYAGTAIFGASGALRAIGRATWILIPPPS